MRRRRYVNTDFSKRLIATFHNSGMSLAKFAEKSGLSSPTVQEYIYNDVTPNVHAAADMAKALGVSLDWLVYGKC